MQNAPTQKQLDYIATLATRRGVKFQAPTTKRAASDQITALKAMGSKTFHEDVAVASMATEIRASETTPKDENTSVRTWGEGDRRADAALMEIVERAAERVGYSVDQGPAIKTAEDAWAALRFFLGGAH